MSDPKQKSRVQFNKLQKRLRHSVGDAIADYNMIENGDKVMVCLSGGKDSFTLLDILMNLQKTAPVDFDLIAVNLDQKQPGFPEHVLPAYLESLSVPYHIIEKDTYSVVKRVIPEGNTTCGLCSRLRRGTLYGYAEANGINKIALGHHRDDLIRTLLMSILYNGEIRSMPPKLLSDNKKNMIIRPLAYCQEADIAAFAKELAFPIIPCTLCGSQENLMRKRVKNLIAQLAQENPKVPSNMLHALSSIKVSQLMDMKYWDFKNLEKQQGEEVKAFSFDEMESAFS